MCDTGHSEQIQGVTLGGQLTARQSGHWDKLLHVEASGVAAVGVQRVLGSADIWEDFLLGPHIRTGTREEHCPCFFVHFLKFCTFPLREVWCL